VFEKDDIRKLVYAFYDEVRRDAVLAPIFATKIAEDEWPRHMTHITEFWCSIFLKTGRYKGNPLQKHLAVNGLTPAHFTHWLLLFQNTAIRVLKPDQAKVIYEMAQRIGQSLQMGLAFNHEKNGCSDHPFVEFGIRRSD